MPQGSSKEIQSSPEAAYRFAGFELYPRERLLRQSNQAIPIQPKMFDALHCLVRKAESLVTKEELTKTLWPSVHVSEANLTNIIVTLRKLIGHDAIRTVSKHGYRFVLPVGGEPGVGAATYERFSRAKELTAQRSLVSVSHARELLWICLAENPGFAPAWAWLGRCCWFLAKFSTREAANVDLASAAFARAFAIDPDLVCAHQFYTLMQADMGGARDAFVRLVGRLERHPGEPESLAGLVHVLRFRGLLQESIDANRRAADLDPAIVTSIPHTLFLAGDYASAIASYGGRAGYYLDAAAWAALGDQQRARTLLRERLNKTPLSDLMSGLMKSLLALLEGDTDGAVRHMEATEVARDPEILVYFARHYSKMGLAGAAIGSLRRAAETGFVCAPETLNSDVWLETIRRHPDFRLLVEDATRRVEAARNISAVE
jgi:tetratricopeptide (TPR) repeat protein